MSRVVIGIGSAHGEDAVGWRVVERLRESEIPDVQWIVARNPLEILDRCDGVASLYLVDGCVGPKVGRLHRMTWPDLQIEQERWRTSHGTDLAGVLRLGTELEMLPPSITLWAIECEGSSIEGSWSDALQRGIEIAVEEIARALHLS